MAIIIPRRVGDFTTEAQRAQRRWSKRGFTTEAQRAQRRWSKRGFTTEEWRMD